MVDTQKIKFARPVPSPRPAVRVPKLYQRPVCCDLGCVLFCRIVGSIAVIAVCYYFAYSLISDTKLKFGMFVA
ncbi:hypothetical protein evm_003762 [Chilo suppressalis]|nr:hypothetical protein evm_003762 [Chilo suppressalis]